jgi:hypothetical protein
VLPEDGIILYVFYIVRYVGTINEYIIMTVSDVLRAVKLHMQIGIFPLPKNTLYTFTTFRKPHCSSSDKHS